MRGAARMGHGGKGTCSNGPGGKHLSDKDVATYWFSWESGGRC